MSESEPFAALLKDGFGHEPCVFYALRRRALNDVAAVRIREEAERRAHALWAYYLTLCSAFAASTTPSGGQRWLLCVWTASPVTLMAPFPAYSFGDGVTRRYVSR